MAKIKGPLLSENAHGSIGKELTYSKRKTVNQTRFQKKQHYTASTTQLTRREYFKTASGWWGEMTAAEQTGFDGYDGKAA